MNFETRPHITLYNWQMPDSWHMPLLRLCRWRWRSVPERRVTATARLFLPSVHCETVTGAKMADNREEISELVEKRGIYRHLSVAISSRRDDPTSSSRGCCRGDASSQLMIAARHAALIAARRCTSPAIERRAWPNKHADGSSARKLLSLPEKHARIIIYDRRESYRETRDVSVTSRHPFVTAVIVVVVHSPSSSPSLIRRDQTRQRANVWQCAISRSA